MSLSLSLIPQDKDCGAHKYLDNNELKSQAYVQGFSEGDCQSQDATDSREFYEIQEVRGEVHTPDKPDFRFMKSNICNYPLTHTKSKKRYPYVENQNAYIRQMSQTHQPPPPKNNIKKTKQFHLQ